MGWKDIVGISVFMVVVVFGVTSCIDKVKEDFESVGGAKGIAVSIGKFAKEVSEEIDANQEESIND